MEYNLNSNPSEIIEDEQLTPAAERIVNQLKLNENKKSSPWGNIFLLLITIALFFGSGLINNPLTDIFILIFVILIHESGHLIAMKIYGYKDVRMFFIPFIGAAVSGSNDNIKASKKAVISMAGPVPGILIGIFLILISAFLRERLIFNAAVIFLSLNTLNLLPLYPFDGGRFMSDIFFARNKYFELIFKILAVAAFFIGALKLQDFILGVIGTGLLLSISTSYKLSSLANEIKEKLNRKFEGRLLDQKNRVLNVIVTGLLGRFPDPRGERLYQNLADDLWDRLKYIPPGNSETILLSVCYLTPWALVILFFLFASGING